MDSRGAKHNCGNGSNKPSPIVSEPVVLGVNKREEEESVRRSLLPRAEMGGAAAAARKSRKGSRRKVQWNDRKGKQLVEVLEYQPSDSSDSDDDYLDSCICSMM